MIIYGFEIPENILNIINDMKSKMGKLNVSCSKSANGNTYTQIKDNHTYNIFFNIETNDTNESVGLKYLHEYTHIYQFENGYYRISNCISKNSSILKLIKTINDFVLDTDVNQFLKVEYNFDIKKVIKTSYKYEAYSKMINQYNNEPVNIFGVRFYSIECAYVYFNNSKKYGLLLIDKFEKIFPNIRNYFNSIINEYKNGIITSATFSKEKLDHLLYIMGVDHALVELSHQ